MKERSAPIREALAKRLRDLGDREREAENALVEVRRERDCAIHEAANEKASNYAIAKLLGLDRSQVGRIVGPRKDAS